MRVFHQRITALLARDGHTDIQTDIVLVAGIEATCYVVYPAPGVWSATRCFEGLPLGQPAILPGATSPRRVGPTLLCHDFQTTFMAEEHKWTFIVFTLEPWSETLLNNQRFHVVIRDHIFHWVGYIKYSSCTFTSIPNGGIFTYIFVQWRKTYDYRFALKAANWSLLRKSRYRLDVQALMVTTRGSGGRWIVSAMLLWLSCLIQTLLRTSFVLKMPVIPSE